MLIDSLKRRTSRYIATATVAVVAAGIAVPATTSAAPPRATSADVYAKCGPLCKEEKGRRKRAKQKLKAILKAHSAELAELQQQQVPETARDLHAVLREFTAPHAPIQPACRSCTTELKGNTNSLLGVPANLYVGALISGDPETVSHGYLSPLGALPPGSGVVSTNAKLKPSAAGAVSVTEDSQSKVRQAESTLEHNSELASGKSGIEISSMHFHEVNSAEEAAFDFNASYSYAGIGKASGSFSTANNEKNHHLAFELTTAYYKLSYEPDKAQPAGYRELDAFFAPGALPLNALECGCMSAAAPPLYVSSVTYGTRFMFTASSKADAKSMQYAIEAAVKSGASNGSASLNQKVKSTLDEMEVQAVAIGGSSEVYAKAASVAIGSAGDGGKTVNDWLATFVRESIQTGAEFVKPISYELEYLDNAPVGEFVAVPPEPKPWFAQSDTTTTMRVVIHIGQDDKECQTPVYFTMRSSEGRVIYNNRVVAGSCQTTAGSICKEAGDPNDYWNHGTVAECEFPIAETHAYEVWGGSFSVDAPGASWKGAFEFILNFPDVGSFSVGKTKENIYFNGGGEGGPPSGCAAPGGLAERTFFLGEPGAATPGTGVGPEDYGCLTKAEVEKYA